MTIRQIPLNDGHTIPQFGLGVFKMTDDEVAAALARAFELGYRHIDTAAIYRNEDAVGRAIEASGLPREDLFVTTKLWNDRHEDAPAALNESLERLGLDYVDLYLIHWPAPKYGLKYRTAWDAMIGLQADGLARSIGVSNFHPEHLRDLTSNADVVPAVNQIELHPTLAQAELRALHADLGIVTEAWSPIQPDEREHPVVVDVATRNGITPAQAIIAWHLARGIVVFPKSANPDRLAENYAATDVTLPDDDLALLDGIDAGTRYGAHPDTTAF